MYDDRIGRSAGAVMKVTIEACPVCKNPAESQVTGDRTLFKCGRCGRFGLSDTALDILPDRLTTPRSRALVSHFLRRMQHAEKWPVATWEVLQNVLKTGSLPTPREQADNVIRLLGDKLQDDPGSEIELEDYEVGGIIGTSSQEGLLYVLQELVKAQSLDAPYLSQGMLKTVRLTFNGWGRYEELRRGAHSGRTAFMAMKFGDTILDAFVASHLRPAVEETGFTLRRLDDDPKAGLIDDRLRVEIRACRFLIADLTHANNGAYWEAGFAEGLGKPVIYTCERSVFSKNSHFDTNHHLTVIWEPDKLDQAAKDLMNTIRATLPEASRSAA